MFLTPYKRHAVSVLAAVTLLSGCGLTQRVTDGTKEVASAIFYKQIKTLHLDFVSRSALNTDAQDTPLSTMIHVWQLKTRERFDEANYDTLLMQEEKTLKSDVLAKHTVWMKPAGAVS
jgi:type VI secretion system protein VasD